MTTLITKSQTPEILRSSRKAVQDHYAHPGSRVDLAVLSLVLSYGGGAAMFWLHAVYRGEKGPPIADQWHWMLDSSLGFLALTPLLLLILPLAKKLGANRGRGRSAVLVGGLFAAVTTPGPVMHYHVAGPETPLAHAATDVFGRAPGVVMAHLHSIEHTLASESLLQLTVGLPVYILLTYLTGAALARVRVLLERRAGGRRTSVEVGSLGIPGRPRRDDVTLAPAFGALR
ncbi:MAG: hypothetical protein M3010_07250 [Candidatus Dormibacteraeota bacterium]|nr:hypothetical protein [Candidatus Dormibacteraeota bacterium]